LELPGRICRHMSPRLWDKFGILRPNGQGCEGYLADGISCLFSFIITFLSRFIHTSLPLYIVYEYTSLLRAQYYLVAKRIFAYRLHAGVPAHLHWSRQAIRGLTWMITDKGPQPQWMREIGKVDDASCVCDGWTPQNAAHLYECPWVGGRWEGEDEGDGNEG